MLLLADMGNTTITVAGWENDAKTFEFRLLTDKEMKPDAYAAQFAEKMAETGCQPSDFEGAVLCSVVPILDEIILDCMENACGHRPLFLDKYGNTDDTEYQGDKPNQLGNDLIAGAIAAKYKYPMPVIVADLGTSTTLTPQDAGGHILGVSIAPGVALGLKALAGGASKLFSVALQVPAHAIGTDTIECIQSGVVLGAAAMLDGMADRMEDEVGSACTLVLTGGLGPVVAAGCRRSWILDPDLLLVGMARYYEINRE